MPSSPVDMNEPQQRDEPAGIRRLQSNKSRRSRSGAGWMSMFARWCERHSNPRLVAVMYVELL